jgi:hypothetical protein
MAVFPKFKVPALKVAPTPHERTRRTRAQIAADDAAKAAMLIGLGSRRRSAS